MRRLASCFAAALMALALASCGKDVPTVRFECTCHAAKIAFDNSRSYVLCESGVDAVTDDAVSQCELDFGTAAGCTCTCARQGECARADGG
jgi:hypothetical protein